MPVAGSAAYARLFAAHALGLVATGVATVALAILAFELAGEESGAVLGTALALKMGVNVLVAPLTAAVFGRVPRRDLMVGLTAARAGALLVLPFVTEVWQVYVLIAAFQAASAAAAATYMATVPDLLPDEEDYAAAVSKSKIAYDVESLLSPLVAAALLLVLDFRGVFVAAVAILVGAAALLATLGLPRPAAQAPDAARRAFGNVRRLLADPELRGALAVSGAAITITAMVTVNTVVLVLGRFGLEEESAAIGLAAYGAGGVAAALLLPRLVTGANERTVMLRAGAVTAALLLTGAALPGYAPMLALWAALGASTTLAQLPMTTLMRRKSLPGDRQGLYAAHYAVTHLLLLVAYLAAGWVGAELGLATAFVALALLAGALAAGAALAWPAERQARGAP